MVSVGISPPILPPPPEPPPLKPLWPDLFRVAALLDPHEPSTPPIPPDPALYHLLLHIPSTSLSLESRFKVVPASDEMLPLSQPPSTHAPPLQFTLPRLLAFMPWVRRLGISGDLGSPLLCSIHLFRRTWLTEHHVGSLLIMLVMAFYDYSRYALNLPRIEDFVDDSILPLTEDITGLRLVSYNALCGIITSFWLSKLDTVLGLKSYCVWSLILVGLDNILKHIYVVIELPLCEDVTILPQFEDVIDLPQCEVVTSGLASYCILCFALSDFCRINVARMMFVTIANTRQWKKTYFPKVSRAWVEAQTLISSPSPTSRTPPISTLIPPNTCSVLVDAWKASTLLSGLGLCFQNSSHHILHQGSPYRYVSSALMAEALAIQAALSAAFVLELPDIAVLSDSLTLISLLNSNEELNELESLLHDIRIFVASFSSIYFLYIMRTANVVAIALAKTVLIAVQSTSL